MPKQLPTVLIEIQSTADHPLYLPAGWEVMKVQDCHVLPREPQRLVSGQQRVVINVMSPLGAGESLATPHDKPPGRIAADTAPGRGGAGKQRLDRSGDLRPNGTGAGHLSGDEPRSGELNSAERARTPDREARSPRPRPVSPDPDRAPAPAAESAKPFQTAEDG